MSRTLRVSEANHRTELRRAELTAWWASPSGGSELCKDEFSEVRSGREKGPGLVVWAEGYSDLWKRT